MTFHFPPVTTLGDSRLPFNLVSQTKPLRCTWIPKNMCTSIKFSFAAHERVLEGAHLRDVLSRPSEIHNWTWLMEPRTLGDLNDPKRLSFAIIRNPQKRTLSAIVEKLLLDPQEYDRIGLTMMRNWAPVCGRPPSKQTFNDIFDYIHRCPDRILDPHFSSQHTFLSGTYQRLLKFENSPGTLHFFQQVGLPDYRVDHHSTAPGHNAFDFDASDTISEVRAAYLKSPERRPRPSERVAVIAAQLSADRFAMDWELWRVAD